MDNLQEMIGMSVSWEPLEFVLIWVKRTLITGLPIYTSRGRTFWRIVAPNVLNLLQVISTETAVEMEITCRKRIEQLRFIFDTKMDEPALGVIAP